MKISEIISLWYEKNSRDLPWRETKDIYRVWLSEIILQQTRVQQGLSYYGRFIDAFPDVQKLAAADEEQVIKLWQGLGYYSRARNLHTAAKQVVNDYAGVFPDCYVELLKLKGVGKYTAAAVASIVFNETVAVVDGNVSRVISRIYGVEEAVNSSKGEKMIQEIANRMLIPERAGDHNQAMMEFGALQCVPSSPDCDSCPIQDKCIAYKEAKVNVLPKKLKKVRVKKRYLYFVILNNRGATYIMKRLESDIWKNMYQFPLIEADVEMEDEAIIDMLPDFVAATSNSFIVKSISQEIKHQLTHRTILSKFIHVDIIIDDYKKNSLWLKIDLERIHDYPLPRLIDRYLEGHHDVFGSAG